MGAVLASLDVSATPPGDWDNPFAFLGDEAWLPELESARRMSFTRSVIEGIPMGADFVSLDISERFCRNHECQSAQMSGLTSSAVLQAILPCHPVTIFEVTNGNTDFFSESLHMDSRRAPHVRHGTAGGKHVAGRRRPAKTQTLAESEHIAYHSNVPQS